MARGVDEPWIAAEALPAALGRAWAREWPRWFGPEGEALPRAPEKPWLARVETPLGPVVAKRELSRTWKRSLAALGARRPRAERAFRLAGELRARGFATPEPLAVLGLPGESVLVTRLVAGAGAWELAREAHERLLACLADGIARLHRAGFRHRDLKASNLLFTGAGSALELVWTDLDGLAWRGTVEPHLRARDLARLCTSFASAEARAAGVRADAWPELVRLYLERALGRAPDGDELAQLLARTRAWSDRNIRRHLAADRPVR
jgi:tRNA A-37 threonylcarbamoyl transferase component Bud32